MALEKKEGAQAATTDPLEATLRRCLAAELKKNRALEEKLLMLELCLAAELAKNRALEEKLLLLKLEMVELKKVKGG